MQLIDDRTDFSAYLAEPEGKVKVRPASGFVAEVVKRFSTPDDMQGVALPWPKTHQQFRLRPNELTLWPGINGHGKSLVNGQVMLHAMAQGERVLIASMEMTPARTLERMARQACGCETPSAKDIEDFLNWTDGRLWIYDHVGAVQWRKLLAVMRYAAAELGVSQFVIDSLMRCGIAETDYDQQKLFVDSLCTFKQDYPVHVHLIMHSRKREDEFALPGKFDAKGSGTIVDLADNCLTVWRNKKKEADFSSSQRVSADLLEKPDALLVVDKQRHASWEGKIGLWFLHGSNQFVQNGVISAPMDLTGHRR